MVNEMNLFDTIRDKLNTALLSDALDSLGVVNQVMHESIRPLDPELTLDAAAPYNCRSGSVGRGSAQVCSMCI